MRSPTHPDDAGAPEPSAWARLQPALLPAERVVPLGGAAHGAREGEGGAEGQAEGDKEGPEGEPVNWTLIPGNFEGRAVPYFITEVVI